MQSLYQARNENLLTNPQAELQQEVENLRRENQLITSAWYDMTSRLQSNTVILQRRSEAPKSWLGKQRVAVGGAGGTVRSPTHIFRTLRVHTC
jgi:protein HOOK3